MKLVKFNNGKFGIRRRFLWYYQYRSVDDEYWWPFQYARRWCQTDEITARQLLRDLTDKGVEI